MLENYQKAFDFLSRSSWSEAREIFELVSRACPGDQTALEFQAMLSKSEAFEYALEIHGSMAMIYPKARLERARLQPFILRGQETSQYLDKLPGLRKNPLFLLVVDESIRHSFADYKMRPWVPKIRVNPSVHLGNISHEMAHLSFINPNRFLTEGFAMHVESHFTEEDGRYFFQRFLDEMVDELIELNVLILEHEDRLDYFSPGCSDPHKKWMAYHQAGSFVRFMIREYGWDRFLDFSDHLSRLFEAQDIRNRVALVYSRSLEEMEKQWKRACFKQATSQGTVEISPSAKGALEALLSLDRGPSLEIEGPTDFEGKLEELEISLSVEGLSCLARQMEIGFREENTKTALCLLARVYLALFNAMDLDLDWFSQDAAELSKVFSGFSSIRDQLLQMLERMIERLEKQIEGGEEDAQVHRVLGELYGRAIKYKGKMAGMIYGPKSEKELRRAHKKEPQNPRVLTAMGRLKLFTPKYFGGGTRVARKFFQEANQADPMFHESYIGLALCAFMEGNRAECQGHLSGALELHHANRFAQKLLSREKKGLPLTP